MAWPADLLLKNTPAQIYFSPDGGCTAAVVAALGSARRTVRVQAYSFTSAPIAGALRDAHDRGVDARERRRLRRIGRKISRPARCAAISPMLGNPRLGGGGGFVCRAAGNDRSVRKLTRNRRAPQGAGSGGVLVKRATNWLSSRTP